MSYEHRSNVQPKGVSMQIKVVGITAVILIVLYLFFPQFLSNFFTTITSPFWRVEKNIRVGNEIVSIDLQNSIIKELQKENFELKSIMHRYATSSAPIISYIIKKPPFSAYDSYIIEIEKDSDVKVGDKVYAIGNVLLGEIVEKNYLTAKVKLYSSYGEKFDVLIGKNNIQATAMGKGGGFFEAILPKDVKIVENDTVMVPDIKISVFGIVKSVSIDSGHSFSTILFSQPINIYEQKWVLIYRKDLK